MNVFISSVIRGFEQYRAAAKDAVEALDMKPVMSEHFGLRPHSPEVACLTEVDQCDLYILILGENYGFECEPGLSVTQQEFQRAVSRRKPIMVLIQDINFEEKQAQFVKEVSNYQLGFFREIFSTSQELMKYITQGINRLERSRSAISEKEFQQRLSEVTDSRMYITQMYGPRLEFAFLPQPADRNAVLDASVSRDLLFKRLNNLELVSIKQGYQEWDDRLFTGIQSGSTSWRIFEDGLTLLETDVGIKPNGQSVGLYYVSPSYLAQILLSCFEVAEFRSGWFRITLKNLDLTKFEEPPAVAQNSYSMPMLREKQLTESHLFIPVTKPIAEQWIKESIARMVRRLSY